MGNGRTYFLIIFGFIGILLAMPMAKDILAEHKMPTLWGYVKWGVGNPQALFRRIISEDHFDHVYANASKIILPISFPQGTVMFSSYLLNETC